MGKFEKKRTDKSLNTESRPVWEEDGYSLDGMRQVHEGRAVYEENPGPVCESSSVRGGWADSRQQDAYAQQADSWQQNPYAQQGDSWQQSGYSEPAPRSRGRDRRRSSGEDQWTNPPQASYSQQPPAEKSPRKRRKKHRLLRFLLHVPITLFGLVILAILLSVLLAKMPQTDQPIGPRKEGVCTILLCGTDQEGQRTDTMVLLYLDRANKTTRLLSLPRDTMVNRDNPVPKLNGVYWANGGSKGNLEQGMDMLLDYVKDLVGYRPDAYMLLDLECFSELVDTMGGVTFDVPMDMYYNDPSQDLKIDLKAGLQKLTGPEAMELVRFRSGYAMADLDRIKVQRDFLKSAISQWKSVLRLPRAAAAARLLLKNTETDLNYRNFCWIAMTLVKGGASSFDSDTLPGEAKWVNGGAYYVEDRQKAAALINEKYNPYETEIKAEDLHPYGK
ncbi:MAG: LCP family protein [Oscillospiraceae bacterium]|nr:LCP family protein [Oscillospiraceae bacterium]